MVHRKFRNLLQHIYHQGMSPQKLALTITLGIVLGTVPVLWGSTVLCSALAVKLRLNQPGIQAVNYLVYPLQIALIGPFYWMGARIFPWGPSLPSDILVKEIMRDWIGNSAPLLVATLKAFAVWLLVAAPLSIVLYFLLMALFARMTRFKAGLENL